MPEKVSAGVVKAGEREMKLMESKLSAAISDWEVKLQDLDLY